MKKKFKDKVQRRFYKALFKVGAVSGVIALILFFLCGLVAAIIGSATIFAISRNIAIYKLRKKYESKNKKVPEWIRNTITKLETHNVKKIDSNINPTTNPAYSSSPCNAFYRY